ncbi:MAG: NUDIX hydrolase, partial [Gammaproteobacteria bacterium]
GESPESAAARELEEELSFYPTELVEVGSFTYKQALHMVYAAEATEPIRSWDDTELIDIGWFTETAVAELKAIDALHANYELEAIQVLIRKLGNEG